MTPDHYFTDNPNSPSEPSVISAQVRGFDLTIHSDRGVFSSDKLDAGSLLLARTMQLPSEGEILDLGCGYGLLGIVAARLAPECKVTLVDINSRAADLARKNCIVNRAPNTEVITGDALEVLGERKFNSILCNPPFHTGKAVYMQLLEDAANRLSDDGILWLVGRTKQGIKTLGKDISPWFAEVTTESIKGGYRILAARKVALEED